MIKPTSPRSKSLITFLNSLSLPRGRPSDYVQEPDAVRFSSTRATDLIDEKIDEILASVLVSPIVPLEPSQTPIMEGFNNSDSSRSAETMTEAGIFLKKEGTSYISGVSVQDFLKNELNSNESKIKLFPRKDGTSYISGDLRRSSFFIDYEYPAVGAHVPRTSTCSEIETKKSALDMGLTLSRSNQETRHFPSKELTASDAAFFNRRYKDVNSSIPERTSEKEFLLEAEDALFKKYARRM